MILPNGAREIIRVRAEGFDPANVVVVDFVGLGLDYEPLVMPRANVQYDWRFLKGLSTYVIWHSLLPNRDKHLKSMIRYVKTPLEFYEMDSGDGATFYWTPTLASVDLLAANKITYQQLKWELDKMDWMRWQKADMKRFIEECLVGTHTEQL